jgi:hypothetical protein
MKTTLTVNGPPSSESEVMPGETSGEVMRRKASAEVMPPSVGSDAGTFAPGGGMIKPLFAGRCTLEAHRPTFLVRNTMVRKETFFAIAKNQERTTNNRGSAGPCS